MLLTILSPSSRQGEPYSHGKTAHRYDSENCFGLTAPTSSHMAKKSISYTGDALIWVYTSIPVFSRYGVTGYHSAACSSQQECVDLLHLVEANYKLSRKRLHALSEVHFWQKRVKANILIPLIFLSEHHGFHGTIIAN
jgi:hypothetical protein